MNIFHRSEPRALDPYPDQKITLWNLYLNFFTALWKILSTLTSLISLPREVSLFAKKFRIFSFKIADFPT